MSTSAGSRSTSVGERAPRVSPAGADRPSHARAWGEYGQRIPFTPDAFADALAHAEKFGNLNKNMTAKMTIGEKSYIVKSVSASGRYSESDQQRNEVATADALRALGMPALAVRAIYSVRGADGRIYSVQSLEAGTARKFGGVADAARAIPARTLQRLVVAQYLLGMQDNHAGNLLVNYATGAVKKIDNSYSFKHDTKLERRDAARAIWQAQAGNKAPLSFSATLLRSALAHEGRVLKTLQRFDLGPRELAGLRARFALLRQAADARPNLTVQQLEHTVGRRLSPWAAR
jgi:hypothetical protein